MRMELIKLIKSGDSEAVGKLYELIRTKSLAIARKYVHDPQDAEDMFQDAFLKAMENIEKFDEDRDFNPWFDTILVNTCKNWLVKKKATNFSELSDEEGEFEDTLENHDDNMVPESAYDRKEMMEIIGGIVDDLPQVQKEAVALFYFKDYSVRKIAELQEVSEDTVKSRLNYARKKVGEAVTTYEKKHGIKLHGVAVIPAFMAMFLKRSAYAAVAEAIISATGITGLAGAAGTAGTAALGTTGTATATAVAGKMSAATILKIAIAAVGVTAVTGTGVYMAVNNTDEKPSAATPATVSDISSADVTTASDVTVSTGVSLSEPEVKPEPEPTPEPEPAPEPEPEPEPTVETETMEDGSYSVTEYAPDGRKNKEDRYLANGTICLSLEYDENEKVVREVLYESDGSLSWARKYEYDENGNRTKAEYTEGPDTGGYDIYTYDENGHMLSAESYYKRSNSRRINYYTYDDAGRLKTVKVGNDKYTYSHDSEGRIVKGTVTRNGSTAVAKFTYGENGRVSKRNVYVGDQLFSSTTYTYYSNGYLKRTTVNIPNSISPPLVADFPAVGTIDEKDPNSLYFYRY